MTLAITAADGCTTQQSIRVDIKDCVSEVLMVVSPYGKTQTCIDVAAGSQLTWCGGKTPDALTLTNTPTDAGVACISATTTGRWAGLAQPCLETCVNGACRQLNVRVVALPKKDTLTTSTNGDVCLSAALQVEGAITGSRLIGNEAAPRLVPTGDNCFRVQRSSSAYPGKTITVIHEYLTGEVPVFDTTLVHIPASDACALQVLAEAGYDHTLGTDEPAELCLDTDLAQTAKLTYTLNGQALSPPALGCEPFKVARFSLAGLPAGYSDNGWRIERYVVNGQVAIRNRVVTSLAEVLTSLESAHPSSTVRLNHGSQHVEVSGGNGAPEVLKLRHLPSSTLLNPTAERSEGYNGSRLSLPKELVAGADYLLIAQAPSGCADTATLRVLKASSTLVDVDTLYVTAEVGEPIYMASLFGFNTESTLPISALAEGFVMIPQAIGRQTVRFVKTEGNQKSERVYILTVEPYACSPLVADTQVDLKVGECLSTQVPLGLTRPRLTTFASSGRVGGKTLVTGEREGGIYDLTALPFRGLTQRFELKEWEGLQQVKSVSGNFQQLIRTLRLEGLDVYVDWNTNRLHAAGENLGRIVLRGEDGRDLNLDPIANVLPTYGSVYMTPGSSAVKVSDGTCTAQVFVSVRCNPVIIFPERELTLALNEELTVPFSTTPLPAGYTLRTEIWKPEGVHASVSADRSELTVRVSEDNGDPLQIRMQACAGDSSCVDLVYNINLESQRCDAGLWVSEERVLTAPSGEERGAFVLPTTFDPATDQLFVDGVVIQTSESRDLIADRTFPTKTDFVAIRTPFGKTVDVIDGDLAAAVRLAFGASEVLESATEIRVKSPMLADGLFGQTAAGIWAPVNSLSERPSAMEVVGLSVGTHVVRIQRTDPETEQTCEDSISVAVDRAPVTNQREELELLVGEQLVYCLPAAREGATVVGLAKDCEEASGERISVTWNQQCVTLEAYEGGSEKICLRRLYLDGGVDSIQLSLEARARVELDVVADRDTLEFGQFKVLEVLHNDQLADEPLSISLVSEPFFGRAQVVGNSAIEYLHYGGDCATDVFTYEVCQGEVCDSTTVELMVFCDELLVYNGMSPNGDGVNEEFTILGLGQYPDHEIAIFNRDGNLLITMKDYANDWQGTIGGAPLPEGTYFYVIDLGGGDSRSGYLQLSR